MGVVPVIRGAPSRVIVKAQVSVPLISRPVPHCREGGTTPMLEPGRYM